MKPRSRHTAHLLRAAFALLLGAVLTWPALADGQSPTATVRDSVDQVLALLKSENLTQEQRWAEIGQIIDKRFDFRSMSQSVLATNWREATSEEKRRFVEYFSQYLADSYRTRIESYTDQRVEYKDEKITGDRATVQTEIVAGDTRTPVIYRMKNNKGDWFCYDVVIEGVSLVAKSQSTFSEIVKAGGMDGLNTALEGRIAAYKQKHGGLPPAK